MWSYHIERPWVKELKLPLKLLRYKIQLIQNPGPLDCESNTLPLSHVGPSEHEISPWLSLQSDLLLYSPISIKLFQAW